MRDKIALVSCSGLSPLGLIVRVATVDLALDNGNIVAACLTASSAQPSKCEPIINDCPVVAITGCSDDCVSTIFKENNIEITKSINVESLLDENNLNPLGVSRLDEDGEIAVDMLKKHILSELEDL